MRVTKPSVLVVEDEMIVARDILQQLLEQGYQPAGHAVCGEEAIQMAEELQPDLVLMDIQMPGAMDGIAAAQIIRTKFALPVVFLTAYAADDTIARAKLTEPFGYILKPFTERELRTVLEMALYKHATERQLRESESVARMHLHRILDDVAAYSITFNAEQQILHVSAGLLARSGYESAELLGHPLHLLLGEAQSHWAVPTVERERGESAAIRELCGKNGTWWPVHMVVTQLSSHAERPRYLLVGRDREAEVAAEARLDWLRRKIRNAQDLLHAESEKRQQLELAFLDIAEREQARIGQELHDDVGQQLAGIAFLGQALHQRLAKAGREEAQDAGWIAQLLAQTLESLRAISRDLSPGGMESGNLEKSLRSLGARAERLHGVACQVRVDASEQVVADLAPMLTLNLFRIAQEALNNALRHGHPELIEIALRLGYRKVCLSVRNDGPGFDVAKATDGIGLRNINVRTRGLGGHVRLRSGHTGTSLLVLLPLSTTPTTALPCKP